MEEGLVCVRDLLTGFGLKPDIRILVASKIITAFDIFRALCLGADICNSARGMMLALGCIQAIKCNTNRCPSGVATNDPRLVRGLVVEDKWRRVLNYHQAVIGEFLGLMVAAGLTDLEQLRRDQVHRRIDHSEIKRLDELYPEVQAGSCLKGIRGIRGEHTRHQIDSPW
jgi:glutamate synthase domain-containing protein 2